MIIIIITIFILLQDSCVEVETDIDSVVKLSMDDVIDEVSKQSVQDHDNEETQVSKETEAKELPNVSTINLFMV